MSNRWMRDTTYTPYVGETTIQCGFQNNAGSSPTIFYSKGLYGAGTLHPVIASIARTGTGVYLFTFADPWPMLVNAWAMQMGANTDTAQINTISNVGTSSAVTAQITTLRSGTPTDIAAGANAICWSGFVFLNSWSQ